MEGRDTPIVVLKGHNYFVVDQDLSKGDRRSDGPALANFFHVEEDCASDHNVRLSHRIKKRRDVTNRDNVQCHEGGRTIEGLEEGRCTTTIRNHDSYQEQMLGQKGKANKRRQETNGEFDATPCENVVLRPPCRGIRCAGRKDTTRLLWLHEFYVVVEGPRRKPLKLIYQALQFLLGDHLPEGAVHNMTDRMRRSIWVLGILHLPAEHVRHFSRRNKGYIFHTELQDEDARTALFGSCPEVVRIENGLKWHQMRYVGTEVPRVVHAEDVQTRRVHVAGRDNHFVCGVTAVQDLVTHNFKLAHLPRSGFCMYPEERLGMELNSPSMMWEHIDDIFHRLRICMCSGRQGASSGSFSMPVLCTVYDFMQVHHNCIGSIAFGGVTCIFLNIPGDDR